MSRQGAASPGTRRRRQRGCRRHRRLSSARRGLSAAVRSAVVGHVSASACGAEIVSGPTDGVGEIAWCGAAVIPGSATSPRVPTQPTALIVGQRRDVGDGEIPAAVTDDPPHRHHPCATYSSPTVSANDTGPTLTSRPASLAAVNTTPDDTKSPDPLRALPRPASTISSATRDRSGSPRIGGPT